MKDAKDAKANAAAEAKKAAGADKTPKSGKPKSLAQSETGWDLPASPTFHDDNGCKYEYNSPNGELMQPDP